MGGGQASQEGSIWPPESWPPALLVNDLKRAQCPGNPTSSVYGTGLHRKACSGSVFNASLWVSSPVGGTHCI